MTNNRTPSQVECWHCQTTFAAGSLGGVISDIEAIDLCPRCGMQYFIRPRTHDEFQSLVLKPDEMPVYQLSKEEVQRRLPPVSRISDAELREGVIELTSNAPAYFWQSPLSEFEDPPEPETYRHGLWKHTLATVSPFKILARSWMEQNRLSAEEYDLGIAALLLHDQRARGNHGLLNQEGVPDHALQMSEVITEFNGLPDRLARPVAAHMGADNIGPSPTSDLEDLVHAADILARASYRERAFPTPLPTELGRE